MNGKREEIRKQGMTGKRETVMLEVPKEWAEAVKKFIDGVEAAKPDTRGGKAVDYAAYEQAVEEQGAALEREAHRSLLQALDIDAERVVINGKLHSQVGRYEGTYKTKVGPVRVLRSLYRKDGERNGRTVDTIELRVGSLEEGWLPATAKAMAFLVQQNPSREAKKAAMELGRLPYSRSSFERVSHALGNLYEISHAEVEDALIEEFVMPSGATAISAGLDRVSVPMEELVKTDGGLAPVCQYRMAYVGTVTVTGAEGEALHTIRYGRMPQGDAGALCEGLAADIACLMRKQPKLRLQLLADGASEMWRLLEQAINPESLGVPVTSLVDLCHLLQKLAPALQVVFGPQSSQQLARWKLRLLNEPGAAWALLADLHASGKLDVQVDQKKPVHEAITYIENNGERMNYAEARARGLPIGSGATEATCKNLFEVRLKRCGARWHEETGAHVVQLRALALSDRWDDGIARTLKPLRSPVRLAA